MGVTTVNFDASKNLATVQTNVWNSRLILVSILT